MKSIIGFSIGEETNEQETVSGSVRETPAEEIPVRSVVGVRFESSNMLLNYYNDLFDLRVGDRVFVSGSKFGEFGIVEKLSTSFRIDLKQYQKVIARPVLEFHGDYERCIDKMITIAPENIHPDTLRSWFIPPAKQDEEAEIAEGEGYIIPLDNMEQCDLIEEKIVERAMDYSSKGRVKYISLKDGIGTAFVSGTTEYEVSFRFDGDEITGLFCTCPYPFLCKHIVAVLIQFRAIWHRLDKPSAFAAIDNEFFWSVVSHGQKVSL